MKSTVLFFAVLLFSCHANKPESTNVKEQKIGFIHSVFFWFGEEATEEEKEAFVTGMYDLAKTPSIRQVYFGPPAMTPRAVVDNSYDYAWITMFEDKEGHDAYQVDSLHKVFIQRYNALFERVAIYDNLVMNE